MSPLGLALILSILPPQISTFVTSPPQERESTPTSCSYVSLNPPSTHHPVAAVIPPLLPSLCPFICLAVSLRCRKLETAGNRQADGRRETEMPQGFSNFI